MLWNPRARTPWVAGSAPMRAPDRLVRVVDLRLASICPAAFFPGRCNETDSSVPILVFNHLQISVPFRSNGAVLGKFVE